MITIFAQMSLSGNIFLFCRTKWVSCLRSRISERIGLQPRGNSYIKCSRSPRFPSRDKGISGAFFDLNSLFPILERGSPKCKQTLFHFESGHFLQLRLLDRDTQLHIHRRDQELLHYRTEISFLRCTQGHPTCILHKL